MKQRNIKGLGAFVESLYTTLPILAVINFISIATILYASVREPLLAYVPWMQLWVFLLILVGITGLTMIGIYLFVLPSIWTFRGKQMFGYESHVTDKLNKILQRLEELENKTEDAVSQLKGDKE